MTIGSRPAAHLALTVPLAPPVMDWAATPGLMPATIAATARHRDSN